MKYETAINLIHSEFKRIDLRFMIVGGFALTAYGVTRLTADVDVMIDEGDFEKVRSVLEQFDYHIGSKHQNFARCQSCDDGLMDIDLLFVGTRTLNRMLKEGKHEMIGCRDFIVPSLNHLIAMKLHAIKYNPKMREFKDLPDVINLIRQNQLDISQEAFRDLCENYGTTELYRRICELLR